MLRRTFCATCIGVEAITVTVEVDVSPGISFFLVGLPDSAVRESQQRIGTALHTVGAKLPGKKIVINMAPADLKKEGSSFDLAIAMGILAASDQYLFNNLEDYIIMGELALDGTIRPVNGALPVAVHAKKEGFRGCIFPFNSAKEASGIDGLDIFGVTRLEEVISILSGEGYVDPLESRQENPEPRSLFNIPDFKDIRGQESAKRGLEIAAAGGHNLIMSGPPGSGKTYMARALAGILPKMTPAESVETSKIYSVAGKTIINGG
ncbi:MAG: ATP-binding protein, partial [Bacteroidales bacterium]|nr:ATP-binding protein [Bacteroidales bacterium]